MRLTIRRRALTGILALVVGGAPLPGRAAAQPAAEGLQVERISHAELVAAMRPERGYDVTATTNSGRFQAQVFVRVGRAAFDRGVDVALIAHSDWCAAFMEHTGLEADELPVFLKRLREHRQDALLDLREGAVVEAGTGRRNPELAMNVRLAFADGPRGADSFSYEDRVSDPAVLIHNEREITFRLLDMGDQIVQDEIRGSKVRPLSGSLGTLFSVIGLAEIRRVRSAIAADGTQVSVANAKKGPLNVPASVTTTPDGRTARGVPEDRDDLTALEALLKEPLDFEFRETEWDVIAAAARQAAATDVQLEVAFIGNAAMRITDGVDVLYTDFPYESGAFGYMEYPDELIDEADGGVALITHAHADHWSPERFADTALTLVAPPGIARGVPAERVEQWGDEITHGVPRITPISTPHTDDHHSFLVRWGDKRLYFTGDTESTDALLAQRDLDAAFVTPWLLGAVRVAGATIDSELVVVYHHAAEQVIAPAAGVHIPVQGSSFMIR